MRVTLLQKNPKVYSCNVYFVRGDWNAINDVNTLIDVGTDDFILQEISEMTSTGVGKRRVEQVVITHEHFDHIGGLRYIVNEYKPNVYAYNLLAGVNNHAYDEQKIKIGDQDAIILHTPGHSQDSICIYCEQDKALFSGDTPLNIRTPGGSYTKDYLIALKRLALFDIRTIYSGHDSPITNNISDILNTTLNNVMKSRIID